MASEIDYRLLKSGEEEEVCRLVKSVFDEFVAPDFEEEGIAEFFRYANAEALAGRTLSKHFVLLAVLDGEMVGMIEMADHSHIAMLFVSLRGQGVAAELVRRAVGICREKRPGISEMSVHASPFAEPIYRKLGFRPIGDLRTENGITYVPMVLRLEG